MVCSRADVESTVYRVKEQDWKLFRKKLPLWQEAYMDRLNQEYIQLLAGDGSASKKFWELENRIHMDQKSIGAVAEMRRSQMYSNMSLWNPHWTGRSWLSMCMPMISMTIICLPNYRGINHFAFFRKSTSSGMPNRNIIPIRFMSKQ